MPRTDDNQQCFRVLYTRHLTKRNKTFHDGFLRRYGDHRAAELSDAEGNTLSRAKLNTEIDGESEEIRCFAGFIVDVDEECTAAEIPKGNKRISGKVQRSNEQNKNPIRMPRFTAAPPKAVGTQKKRKLEPGQKTDSALGPTSSKQQKIRSNSEVLNLFLNPSTVVEKEGPESKSVKSISVRFKSIEKANPLKRPSVKQKYERARFDGNKLDLRFSLFGKKSERLVSIPESFDTSESYRQIWKAAVHEEMQLRLNSIATRISSALRTAETVDRNQQTCPFIKDDSGAGLATTFKKIGIEYFASVALTLYRKEKREDDLFFLELRNLNGETRPPAKFNCTA